jgi:hypothetical protein
MLSAVQIVERGMIGILKYDMTPVLENVPIREGSDEDIC